LEEVKDNRHNFQQRISKVMVKVLLLSCGLALISVDSFSQKANDFLVGGALDLIKTDNEGFVQKAQVGGELNYFITRKFTATGGLDIWADNVMSLVVGTRWYPADHFFVRGRVLFGKNDVTLGAGWTKPLGSNFQFEAMGDFYFEGEFAIRAGLMYLIRR
jgi:hypothetical protein